MLLCDISGRGSRVRHGVCVCRELRGDVQQLHLSLSVDQRPLRMNREKSVYYSSRHETRHPALLDAEGTGKHRTASIVCYCVISQGVGPHGVKA